MFSSRCTKADKNAANMRIVGMEGYVVRLAEDTGEPLCHVFLRRSLTVTLHFTHDGAEPQMLVVEASGILNVSRLACQD